MIPSPPTLSQPPSLSVAYLLLLYRQANPARSRLSGRCIQSYLDFCLAHHLRVGPWSSVFFARKNGVRISPGLRNWLIFYEQMGSPPLLNAACLAATVSLGAYPIADLIRFWQWHHRGTANPRIRVIRVALCRWLTYVQETARKGTLGVEDVSGFLVYLGQNGWGILAIEHQLLALRQWADWLWQGRDGLALAPHQKAQLRRIGGLTWDEGCGLLNLLAVSPDWRTVVYAYRVDVAAPVIEALLRLGIPLFEIASLQLNQLRFGYVDEALIQLNGRCWTLCGDQARALKRYLVAGGRWGFCGSLPEQLLFIETDWPTLWTLSRRWLGQARLERRLARSRNQLLPIYPLMN